MTGHNPIDDLIERAVEVLSAEIHEAWEFQYDHCDHGTYMGGYLNGERYAMCEITAERIIRRRAADGLLAGTGTGTEARETWWVLRSDDFGRALARAHNGEDPAALYIEFYANSRVEQEGGQS